ncbi:MAG TPA: Asp-tRNA(Asn)/Glu-tRNA(Gln) amidotransferase subunit GatA [Nitrospirae bacterium]|nr:glutamyl-tRNA(Gln) amidotransferase subunit A [bacterium BMS3Abin06]HDH11575.1 Asp-tRNA(Asn)/Glu-tRNA(Gln) amidotransferase subunit GatA [Nitrospirota bacterium]HDZ01968.1 Asp-tRNA(Asn)/Glu-tRNA(Gln) amidotransferase subunit GatA [Nitrospirota bacterium]
MSIDEARSAIVRGEIRPLELVIALFERIDALEERVGAYVSLTRENALSRARQAEDDLKQNAGKALTGIPLAIKDNICTEGIKTTCSSKILENFIPPYESSVTQRLKSEGYILIGKTNLDEFAMGSSTENSAFGLTKNPWDFERVPGGSSGGSAAAVASDECIAALGSDTGGSIRQPAAFCGVVGLKPTYGRVSRYGLVAFASSLDQIGPITKNVRDSAILMNIISGHDPYDSTSADMPASDFTSGLGQEIKGLKIGIPKEYFIEGLDKEVENSVKEAIKKLESLGGIPVEISLPHTEYAVAAYYILATSEASSNLARYDGVKYGLRSDGEDLIDMYMRTRDEGFGAEVKRRIILGTYALSSGYYDAYYKKAQQVRTLIKEDFEKAFENVDVIVTPTTPTPAFKIGEKIEDPLQMYLTDIFTLSVNLAGVPGISIPCGFTSRNLPVGLQIIGKHFDEESILKVAYAYEQATDWHKKKPNI